uniref:F-box domain-containing protein n=1 Tax=Sciurus vulgaris TaxID=55149 RepID=A0A8D2D0A1_SCIVU
MEMQLPDVPMVKIFSYLDAFSLLQASKVNKNWNKIAESDFLWRRLCLKKWRFCNFTYERLGTQTWKQLFLHQTKQERRMACAQSEDFIYKEAAENLGFGTAYLSGSGITVDGQGKSIICIVSSTCKLYTWDVQEGTMIWSSPAQQSNITNLETLPQMHLAITADMERTIKVWNCHDRDPLATCTITRICFSLKAFLTKDGPFLMVGDSDGNIHTFTMPELRDISKVHAFQYSVDLLLCSPDKKWVFACGIHQHILPKVFFTECLLRPSEYSTPLYFTVPFASCYRGCWTPRRENRITLMYRRGSQKKTGFTTFDLTAESPWGRKDIQAHQIASFLLPVHIDSPNWMGVGDGSIIVFESGSYLFLFTVNGLMLQRFEGHQSTISNIWVDSLHVLAASVDGSIHVYMWEEGGHYPYLKRCCHLEYMGSSLTPSCQVSRAICDNVSIVRVVSRVHESNILVMYALNS